MSARVARRVGLARGGDDAARADPGAATSINPDRPDVTNSPQLVDTGLVQIESGVTWTRQDAAHRAFGTPIVARIGVRDWLEAQVGSDGLLTQTDMGEHATGVGNVRLGAKVRLLANPGQPRPLHDPSDGESAGGAWRETTGVG